MKKWSALIYCAMSLLYNNAIAQVSFPQLQAGVHINDSIESLYYYFFGSCNPLYEVDVILDSNVIPVATGVELNYIVTQLTTTPNSVYSIQNGVLHLYDTLKYSANLPFYRFYSSSTGFMHLKLMLVGTPTIPFENYSCEFIKLITLANCANGAGILGLQNQCSVDNFNGINESKYNKYFTIRPNPANDYIEINSLLNLTTELTFSLFNLQGEVKHKEKLSLYFNTKRINLEGIPDGIYIWKIYDHSEIKQTGKLIINKSECDYSIIHNSSKIRASHNTKQPPGSTNSPI